MSKLEVEDIPLILELSLSLSATEIAKKWEVAPDRLSAFLTSNGCSINSHRKEHNKAKVRDWLDAGLDRFDIAAELDCCASKAYLLIKEVKSERASNPS